MSAPTAAVVGSGLIGASAGLALRKAGWEVTLYDVRPEVARRAEELGAGRAAGLPGTAVADADVVDVAILAMPPQAVAASLLAVQAVGLARTYTDVASSKVVPARDAARLGCDLASYVGGHPMAGRERSGPGAARSDLFAGVPWIVTPGDAAHEHVERVVAMVEAAGARPVLLDAATHDAAVAVVSHVPQVAASLVAARLVEAPDQAVALAGQGIRDVTRIAGSDPDLWAGILQANAAPVLDVLTALRDDLDTVLAALRSVAAGDSDSVSVIRQTVATGALGRSRLPGKHGAPPATYAAVPVVVADRPGELARLFVDAGAAGINVEDVRIEHSPGQPVGTVELAVRPAAADALATALRAVGWTVHR